MPPPTAGPMFDRFMATAESVADARPEVDPDLAREVFAEAATLLDNGLALDGLDEHDTAAVIAGLCEDLVADDPGAAVRDHITSALARPRDHHDARGVAAAYEKAEGILQL